MKYSQLNTYGGCQVTIGDKITDPVVKEIKTFLDSILEDFKLEMHKGQPITKFDTFYQGTLTVDKWGTSQAFISMPHIAREKLNKIFIEYCVYKSDNQEFFEIHLSDGVSIRAERFSDCFTEFILQLIENLKKEDMNLRKSINWFVTKWETLPSNKKATVIEYGEFV